MFMLKLPWPVLSVLPECLCVYLNIPEAKGRRVPVWRGRKGFYFYIIADLIFLGLHEHPTLFRGQHCFTVCVKAFGPVTRNYYVRAVLHAAWVYYSFLFLVDILLIHKRKPVILKAIFCLLESVFLEVSCSPLSWDVCASASPASFILWWGLGFF